MYLIVFLIIIIIILQFSVESPDNPVIHRVYDDLITIHPKAKTLKISEGNQSFTVNKKKIHLCIKDRNGVTYNHNMLLYVAIHELSHGLCDENHHTQKFNKINLLLLNRATELGLYDPSIKLSPDYCKI